MSRHHFLTSAIALFLLAAGSAYGATLPGDAKPAVAAVLRTLQDGDPASASAFTGIETWRDLRELTRPFGRCVVIESSTAETVEASPHELLLHVSIDAHATTQHERIRSLPRDWFVRLRRASDRWLIAEAETGERRAGRALFEAGSDQKRRVLMEQFGQYRPADLAVELATQVWMRVPGTSSPPRALLDAQTALMFAVDLAERSGDMFAIVWTMTTLVASPYRPDVEGLSSIARRAEDSDDCDAQALALIQLGNGRNRIGDGTAILLRTASMVDSVDDPTGPLKALHNLVAYHVSTGRITEAVGEALALARLSVEHHWREGEAMAAMDLGDVYNSVGRLDLAATYEWRAFDLLRLDGKLAWAADALAQAAELEAQLGSYRRAIALYRRAVEMSANGSVFDRATILLQLGTALAKSGNTREADRLLAQSYGLLGTAAGSSAVGLARAELRAAEHRDRDVVDLLKELSSIDQPFEGDLLWRALALRGQARMKLGEHAAAIRDFRDAVTVIERRRAALPADLLARERYFTARITPYRELTDALLRQGAATDALAAAERSKARLLAEAMVFGHPGALRGDTASAELGWREPPAAPSVAPDKPLRLGRLDRRRTVIEYVAGASALDIFVIRGGTVRARRVHVSHAQLARTAEQVHDAVAARRLDYRDAVARAYRLLLQPIAQWLPVSGPIAIVPDEELWRVPFQVLAPAGGEPLVVNHDIVYSPSLTMLEAAAGRRSTAPTLLALGNPSLPRGRAETLPPLPDAQREVEEIASLYGGDGAAYVGAGAAETRLKQLAASQSVLHIATHALMDPQSPWASALVLTPGRGDDGLLEAQEILQLGLHCDLAVLSACRTAEGSLQPGEGVIGLAWAFLAAGSRAAVVSQWSVDSAASAPLMVALHRQYRAGLPADAALRRAQLALRADHRYAHPFFWGSFMVIGRP